MILSQAAPTSAKWFTLMEGGGVGAAEDGAVLASFPPFASAWGFDAALFPIKASTGTATELPNCKQKDSAQSNKMEA